MKDKKNTLRLTTIIVVLLTILTITKIKSFARSRTPMAFGYTTYKIKDGKLVDNKMYVTYGNYLYDNNGNLKSKSIADENGNLKKEVFETYSLCFANLSISLYIDNSEEPYKRYEMTPKEFFSPENSYRRVTKGFSCSAYDVCDNIYEFDLNNVEIKESIEVIYYSENVARSEYIYPCVYIDKFDCHSENGEVIIDREYPNEYVTEIFPKISTDTEYEIINDKLVDNKIYGIWANRLYDNQGNLKIYSSNDDIQKVYDEYGRFYSDMSAALYIDDNEEPYKKYEISIEELLSAENAYKTSYNGSSHVTTFLCDKKYEFDLTNIEIKESFRVVYYSKVSYKLYKITYKFDCHSENGEIIIDGINDKVAGMENVKI